MKARVKSESALSSGLNGKRLKGHTVRTMFLRISDFGFPSDFRNSPFEFAIPRIILYSIPKTRPL
jgi:hypothetical protein